MPTQRRRKNESSDHSCVASDWRNGNNVYPCSLHHSNNWGSDWSLYLQRTKFLRRPLRVIIRWNTATIHQCLDLANIPAIPRTGTNLLHSRVNGQNGMLHVSTCH